MESRGANVLRPLAGVRDAVAALRIGGGDAEAERSAYLRVSDAVEATLRRLLRDEEDVPLDTRLRALAPDEMALDEVVAVLRQRDRITLETGAGVHDMASVRRRLAAGGAPVPRDVGGLVSLVERIEREASARPAPTRAGPSPAQPPPPVWGPDREPVARSAVSGRAALVPPWTWAAAAALILVVVALGLWLGRDRRAPELSEGITLFRSGDFERAAAHFERYVARRPDDPTGRLYLARVYRRLGRHEPASQQLREGLESAPRDAALHRELGLLLLDVGRPDAAVGRFRTAVELDPESTEGWLGLVRSLRETGDHEAAERVLARAPAEVRAIVPPAAGARAGPSPDPGT
jgi:tetratricopeptide (TPR) repeat protein